MAYSGEATIFSGNVDWYPGDPISFIPDADLYPANTRSYPGGYIRLDASLSASEDGLDVLYFKWEILSGPEGVSVGPIQQPSDFEQRYSLKTPYTGVYEIGLYVWGAGGGVSAQAKTIIISLVRNSAYNNQVALDVSWVWDNLPSFWKSLPAEDRGRIEIFWRGIQQLVSGDLLDAYNTDDAKSITTVQSERLARWLQIPTRLDISGLEATLVPLYEMSGEWDGGSLTLSDGVPWLSGPSIDLDGQVLTLSRVSALGTLGLFSPQESDTGRSIYVSYQGVRVRRRVIHVEVDVHTAGRSAVYTLDAPLPTVMQGRSVKVSVTSEMPDRVVVEAAGEVGLVLGVSGTTIRTSLSNPQGPLRTLCYIDASDIDTSCVTAGDRVLVDVQLLGSSVRSTVSLLVVGVVGGLVAVAPESGGYSDVVSSVLIDISDDPEPDIDALCSHTASIAWSGTTWKGDRRLVIPRGRAYRTVTVLPKSIQLRSRLPVHEDIISLPTITEFIEYHQAFSDGIVTDTGRGIVLGRSPLRLVENLNYALSDGIIELGDPLPLPTPAQLWAETAIVDNRGVLEKNYGSVLGLTADSWDLIAGEGVTYRSALMGLYVARMMGATIENLRTSVGILAGIPFTDEPAVITAIDGAYEIDLNTAEPTIARIVIEALDESGGRTGIVRSFEVRLNRDDTDPLTTGISFGRSGRLSPGDVLSRFKLLGEGVVIEDILSRGESSAFLRNRFVVKIDVESCSLTHGTTRLIYEVLSEAKPIYTDLTLRLYRYVRDRIEIDAQMYVTLRSQLIDLGGHTHSVADVYDDYVPGYQRVDIPTYTPLTTWFPSDGELSVEAGRLVLRTGTGGMLGVFGDKVVYSDARRGAIKVNYTADMYPGTGAWVSDSDYVIFRSRALSGMYRVLSVTSDTELMLDPTSPSGDEMPVAVGSNLSFTVVRLVTDIVFDGVILESGSQGIKIVRLGAVNNGIAAGDEVSFPEFGLARRPVLAVNEARTEGGFPAVFISVDQPPALLTAELAAGSRVVVRRPRVRRRYRGEFDLTRHTAGPHCFSLSSEGLFGAAASGIDRGDVVRFADGTETDVTATFGDLMWLRTSPSGESFQVTIHDIYGVGVGDDVDLTERSVYSGCSIIVKDVLSYTGGRWAEEYTSGMYVRVVEGRTILIEDQLGAAHVARPAPGDLIRIIRGPLSRFKGDAGQGCFRVASVLPHILTAEPIPAEAQDRFEVSLIRQSRNISNYWRRS